jgi:hypothetical protein
MNGKIINLVITHVLQSGPQRTISHVSFNEYGVPCWARSGLRPNNGSVQGPCFITPPPPAFLISGWGSNVATATLVKVEEKKRKEEVKRRKVPSVPTTGIFRRFTF